MQATTKNVFKRATVGGRVETHVDGRGLADLILAADELSYMSPDAAMAAVALEQELTLDALAGVDLRVRLVGASVSAQ